MGQLDPARLELSEIEKYCGTTCEEYQELHKVLQSANSIKPSHFATRVMPAIAATSMPVAFEDGGTLGVDDRPRGAVRSDSLGQALRGARALISFTKAASQCAE